LARQNVPAPAASDVGGLLKRQRNEHVWSVFQGTYNISFLPEWILNVAPDSHDPCYLGSLREIKGRILMDILIAYPLKTKVRASLNDKKIEIPHALSLKSKFLCVMLKLFFGSLLSKIFFSKMAFLYV